MNPLVIWAVAFSFVAMFFWGASDVVSAKVYRSIGSLKGVLFSQLIGIPILLLLLPLETHIGSINFWPIFLLGMADAGVWWLFSYAAKVGNIAAVGPIFQTSFVTTVVLSVLFLGENITTGKVLGVVFILLGVVLLSLKLESLKKGLKEGSIYKGVVPALLGAIGAGAYLFLLAPLVRTNGWVNTTLIVRCGVALSILILAISRKEMVNFKWRSAPWKIIIPMAFLDQFALVSYNIAIKTLDVSIVSIIVSASVLVTVVLAAIFLKDKLTLIQKIGAVSVVAGLISLSI